MPSATAAGQTAVHCGRGFHGEGGHGTSSGLTVRQGGTAAAVGTVGTVATVLPGPGCPAPGLLP